MRCGLQVDVIYTGESMLYGRLKHPRSLSKLFFGGCYHVMRSSGVEGATVSVIAPCLRTALASPSPLLRFWWSTGLCSEILASEAEQHTAPDG